jgi:NADH dehydrogenase
VVGQVNPMLASLHRESELRAAVKGADIVINLIGALTESRRAPFSAVMGTSAGKLAKLAAEAGATRFIQISAIGANEQSKSSYARAKGLGERLVREHFPGATILRPSLVFGPEDQFFNRFAHLARFTPALPLIGGGKTKFQPVYVGDVAAAIAKVVENDFTIGQTYELAGPEVLSFRALMEKMLAEIRRNRLLVTLPFALARLQAKFLELVPGKPLTQDQVELLKHDVVAGSSLPGLAALGLQPTALDQILPTYLDRFRKGGRFHDGPHAQSAYI